MALVVVCRHYQVLLTGFRQHAASSNRHGVHPHGAHVPVWPPCCTVWVCVSLDVAPLLRLAVHVCVGSRGVRRHWLWRDLRSNLRMTDRCYVACDSSEAFPWITLWVMQHSSVRENQKRVELVVGDVKGRSHEDAYLAQRNKVEQQDKSSEIDFKPADNSHVHLPFVDDHGHKTMLNISFSQLQVWGNGNAPAAVGWHGDLVLGVRVCTQVGAGNNATQQNTITLTASNPKWTCGRKRHAKGIVRQFVRACRDAYTKKLHNKTLIKCVLLRTR